MLNKVCKNTLIHSSNTLSARCRLNGLDATPSFLRRSVSGQNGVTLIELLVALAIVAVVAAMGLPSFKDQYHAGRVKAQAQRMLAAVIAARGKAMATGSDVSLCPWWSAQDIPCTGEFGRGFAVLSALDEHQLTYPEREGIAVWNRQGTAPVSGRIVWNARGLGNRNVTLLFCSQDTTSHWALVLNRVGRPHLRRDWGTCPA